MPVAKASARCVIPAPARARRTAAPTSARTSGSALRAPALPRTVLNVVLRRMRRGDGVGLARGRSGAVDGVPGRLQQAVRRDVERLRDAKNGRERDVRLARLDALEMAEIAVHSRRSLLERQPELVAKRAHLRADLAGLRSKLPGPSVRARRLVVAGGWHPPSVGRALLGHHGAQGETPR